MPTLPSPEEAREKLKKKIKELETSIEKYVENAEAYNRDWDDDGLPEVDDGESGDARSVLRLGQVAYEV